MENIIKGMIKESISVKEEIFKSKLILDSIRKISEKVIETYKNKKKLLVCGNGGSAADAQHIVAELVGKFKQERRGLAAISLNTNTSVLTAVGNDYCISRIFSRQVEALGESGDLLIGISTSGNSTNVYEAFKIAKEMDIVTVGLLGGNGGEILDWSDIALVVPSVNTPRIQESHIMIGHIICEIVERELFG